MASDPWTNPDPQPGDFDSDLTGLDPRYVHLSDGEPDSRLFVAVGIQGDDVARLQRVSEARGKTPARTIAELLREADRSTA